MSNPTPRVHRTTTPDAASIAGLERLIPERVVIEMTGFSRSVLRRRIIAGEFPVPICLGVIRKNERPTRVAWLLSEVEAWIAQKAADSRVNWRRMQERAASEAADLGA